MGCNFSKNQLCFFVPTPFRPTDLVNVIKALIKLLWGEFPGDQVVWGFPGGSTSGKEPAANAGDIKDVGSIPGSGRSP